MFEQPALESIEDTESQVYEFNDIDGDLNIGVDIGEYIVFATEQPSSWTLNFAHKSDDLNKGDWMDTLTGKGAFSTMRLLKPAFEMIIAELDRRGVNWICNTDARRAKLYSRYIPKEKINII